MLHDQIVQTKRNSGGTKTRPHVGPNLCIVQHSNNPHVKTILIVANEEKGM